MQQLKIKTNKNKEVIDITGIVNDLLMKNSYHNGHCYLFLTHTTCGITTADLDPGTDQDYINAFMELIPKIQYNHPHDPAHFGDHFLASIVGPGLYVPVQNASMVLGSYQKVVLFEFSGPRERTLLVNYIKEP
ncbi:YjbQ family protein [Candidatus Woesebacteria bacterium]|nr:YjbQ family protein [Candidatus Woesebacteria bacterium]